MNDRQPNLTVRVKLVDLNYKGTAHQLTNWRGTQAQISALVGTSVEANQRPLFLDVQPKRRSDSEGGEICLSSGLAVHHRDFENHIENCSVCSNRVELQLDFIETLQAAFYQHQAKPNSDSLRGALLVSTPELNFAICGELQP